MDRARRRLAAARIFSPVEPVVVRQGFESQYGLVREAAGRRVALRAEELMMPLYGIGFERCLWERPAVWVSESGIRVAVPDSRVWQTR